MRISLIAGLALQSIGILQGLAALSGCGSQPAVKHANLLDQTTAGKNRCTVAKSHDRPFVLEWDATDLTEFEARAKRDIVFVQYDGCDLRVLAGCTDEGVAGRYGAYYPPQFTSGNVEGIDIENESDLYAKLPLGAASLEARVQAGEQLHLSYYVAGVARATREAVYAGDFASNPRCKDATHFVSSFSLGAFELKVKEHDKVGAGAGVVGIASGGASRSHQATTLKRGGKLEACTNDSIADTSACRVPIRLSLRPIDKGTRPQASEPASASASASIPGLNGDALRLRQSAIQKAQLGDGVGCLADLDRAAQLDPPGDPGQDMTRAECEMRSGKCDAGRRRYRSALIALGQQRNYSDEMLDQSVSAAAALNCPAEQLSKEEQLSRATTEVNRAMVRRDYPACAAQGAKLAAVLKDAAPALRKSYAQFLLTPVQCAVNANQCDDARTLLTALQDLLETPAKDRAGEAKIRLGACQSKK